MKTIISILLFVLSLSLTAYGQKLGKPTLTPSPLTAAQKQTLNEGVALHDDKKYAEAIAKYRSILEENPNSAAAMYELSLSLQEKGDKLEAVETAYRGTKYIADELPLFYVLIANNLDDYGKPDEAITIYNDGLKALEGDSRFGKYRASLYFNLGVTYLKQKKYAEARKVLKSAVENDYNYPSPHFLLSYVYQGLKYKVPAFLAASRFLSLEYNTNRSGTAANLIVDALKPAEKDPKTGNVTINLNFDAPKDEGDFSMYELFLGTLTTVKDDKDKNTTESEMFVSAISTLIALIEEDKKLKSTFVGQNYVPFVTEMKKQGYAEVFGYMVLYISGNRDAHTWFEKNDAKLSQFLAWAKAYQLPAK